MDSTDIDFGLEPRALVPDFKKNPKKIHIGKKRNRKNSTFGIEARIDNSVFSNVEFFTM